MNKPHKTKKAVWGLLWEILVNGVNLYAHSTYNTKVQK